MFHTFFIITEFVMKKMMMVICKGANSPTDVKLTLLSFAVVHAHARVSNGACVQ